MKRKNITTEEAIKLIIDEKELVNVNINGNLILDNRIEGKNVRMDNAFINGNLGILTTIKTLYMPNTSVMGNIDLLFAEIQLSIDFRRTKFDALYADGAIALAIHMSIQSKMVTSPSKLFSLV